MAASGETGSAAYLSASAYTSTSRFNSRSASACAAALAVGAVELSFGSDCPPKSGPASKTGSTLSELQRKPGRLLLSMPFQSQRNELIDQLGVRNATAFPHLRIHADGGEPRQGIDFVDEQLPVLPVAKKIHARQSGTLYRS